MDISIDKQTENKLLGRKEIHFTAKYSGKTPSRDELKEELCKKLNLDPSRTVIVRASQLYGSPSSEVVAYSYESDEAMKTVPEYITKRGAPKAEKGAAGKSAEGKAQGAATEGGNAAEGEGGNK